MITGKIMSVRSVALISPPTITMASGFCVSEPIPVEIAAGSKPNMAINAVITTGRTRLIAPALMDWLSGMCLSRFCLITEMIMTPF